MNNTSCNFVDKKTYRRNWKWTMGKNGNEEYYNIQYWDLCHKKIYATNKSGVYYTDDTWSLNSIGLNVKIKKIKVFVESW